MAINWTLFGVIFSIITLGAGGGYLIWLKTRPKKEVWGAKIYTLSEGIIPKRKDAKGNIISDIELRELIPYKRDVVEKVDKKHGQTIYKLKSTNRPLPSVEDNCVEQWGKDKEVSILMRDGAYVPLRKGYDDNGNKIFIPTPYDTVNLISQQITMKRDRLVDEKNTLAAVIPYMVIGMAIFGLIGVAYLLGDTMVKINETQAQSAREMGQNQIQVAEQFKDGITQLNDAINSVNDRLGRQQLEPIE